MILRKTNPVVPALVAAFALALSTPLHAKDAQKVFDVLEYGAVGDCVALDTPAIQRAIDAAAAAGGGARVRVHSGHRYLVGTLELRGGIDFHLDGGAELVVSTNRADYRGDGVITALNADHLRITGSGKITGRSLDFMTGYDPKGEWWLFAEWRPKMFVLTGCNDLEIRDITFGDAPYWGLHMLGCRGVLVDHVTVRNRMDVPNCDGIDPDHCQDVEIRNCHVVCGDDAIVVKTTRQSTDYGPCARIFVHDCVVETQDSGVKIGTETVQAIYDVRFERCKVVSGSRGVTIQLRDEGDVHDIEFRDIQILSRYYADPWWGRGEAISLTAIPRTPQTRLGILHHVRVQNVTARAENSVRVSGTPDNHIHDVQLENVAVVLDRWTRYKGGLFDNRPTSAFEPVEYHGTAGFSLRFADNVLVRNCRVKWGSNRPSYFTFALEVEQVVGLKVTGFKGEAAHPDHDEAIWIR
jgi:polygalacturonase